MSSRLALLISLAVNVLLVGVVGGATLADLRNQRDRGEAAIGRAPNMRTLLSALPPERAQEVRARVVDAWRDAREQRRAARQARVAVAQAVGAETYDAVAVRRAFAQMRAADGALAEHFQGVVVDAMATMTVQERRALLRDLIRQRVQGRQFPAAVAPDAAPDAPPQP
jgi:uncharacterized membrane protein